jgi:hypothetical protein
MIKIFPGAKAYFSLLISSSESVIFNLKKIHN